MNLKPISQIVSKYTEINCVKSILQTKPQLFSNFKLEKLKDLEKDSFVSLNQLFCKMPKEENEILPEILRNTKMGKAFAKKIPEIRFKENEESSVFKINGELIAKSEKGNNVLSELGVNDSQEIRKLAYEGIDFGLLHNHPMEGPLSNLDFRTFFGFHLKTMMATLPSGGYSSISRTKSLLNVDENSELIKDILKYINNETFAEIKMSRTNLTNTEIAKIMAKFRHEQLSKFVEKYKDYGLKYEYKHKDVNCGIIPDIKNIHKDIKTTIINDWKHTPEEADAILKEIDETPLENFYI